MFINVSLWDAADAISLPDGIRAAVTTKQQTPASRSMRVVNGDTPRGEAEQRLLSITSTAPLALACSASRVITPFVTSAGAFLNMLCDAITHIGPRGSVRRVRVFS